MLRWARAHTLCQLSKEEIQLKRSPEQLQIRCLRSSHYFTIITCWNLTACVRLLQNQLFRLKALGILNTEYQRAQLSPEKN